MLRKKEGKGWDPVFAGAVFGHSVIHYPCLPALINTFTPIKDPLYHPTSYLPHSFFGWSDVSEKIEKLVAITKVLHQKFDNFSFHVNRQASQPSSSATDVIVIINNPVDLD